MTDYPNLAAYYQTILDAGSLPPNWDDKAHPRFSAPSTIPGWVDITNNTWIQKRDHVYCVSSRYGGCVEGKFLTLAEAMAHVDLFTRRTKGFCVVRTDISQHKHRVQSLILATGSTGSSVTLEPGSHLGRVSCVVDWYDTRGLTLYPDLQAFIEALPPEQRFVWGSRV